MTDETVTSYSTPAGSRTPVLILVPDLPEVPLEARQTNRDIAVLAERFHHSLGWGTRFSLMPGQTGSGSSFSFDSWVETLSEVVRTTAPDPDSSSVWLLGAGFGGTVAARVASIVPEIAGLVLTSTPSNVHNWLAQPTHLMARLKHAGLMPQEPEDPDLWRRELRGIDVPEDVRRCNPRPVLVIHGEDDRSVPPTAARSIADRGGRHVQLRLMRGAGHETHVDPRVLAIIETWLVAHAGTV